MIGITGPTSSQSSPPFRCPGHITRTAPSPARGCFRQSPSRRSGGVLLARSGETACTDNEAVAVLLAAVSSEASKSAGHSVGQSPPPPQHPRQIVLIRTYQG